MDSPRRQRLDLRPAASASTSGLDTLPRRLSPALPDTGRNPGLSERAAAHLRAERKLAQQIFERCHLSILQACAHSLVSPEFLGALTASESGGNSKAARFEPAVYRHLSAVANGRFPVFAGIRAPELDAELEEMLHPKAGGFHARYLGPGFTTDHRDQLARLEEEALRELATSWGFTQIMGYHMVGREGTSRQLIDPDFHYRLAVELLAEFARDFELDPGVEFEEMFRCWNTGSPYGNTFDPEYVAKGLARLKLYREVAQGNSSRR